MSQVFYEDIRNGAYLGPYDTDMSNEEVVFASGAFIEAGTIMGKITASEKYTPLIQQHQMAVKSLRGFLLPLLMQQRQINVP